MARRGKAENLSRKPTTRSGCRDAQRSEAADSDWEYASYPNI
jgi:hypothetical protein